MAIRDTIKPDDSTRVLCDWITATRAALDRCLEELEDGADPADIARAVSFAVAKWQPDLDEIREAPRDEIACALAQRAPCKRVLLVDASKADRALAAPWLRRAGYRVSTAACAARAWAMLRRERFDVVVSDRQLLDDGRELIHRVKTHPGLAHLPVILLTDRDTLRDRQTGLAAGAYQYIIKHERDTFRRLIESIKLVTLRPLAP